MRQQRIIGRTASGKPVFEISGADGAEEESKFHGLSDDELEQALADAIAKFDELKANDAVSEDDLVAMRDLATDIGAMRSEQGKREKEAEKVAAEIEDLASQVHANSDPEPDPEPDPDPASDPDPNADPEADPNADPASDPEPNVEVEKEKAIAASASASRRLNLQAIRARQKRADPPKDAPRGIVELMASADVPGFAPGQTLQGLDEVASAVSEQARAIATRSGSPRHQAKAARYALPFDDELQVREIEAVEGTSVTAAAADQARLPGGDLVASGGWCAPSETIYDVAGVACPDMLWNPPEIQLMRGGVRVIPTPTLDVSELTFTHTEADDIAGNTKDCFKIPCIEPREFRCEAKGACIEAGLLTSRAFPELIERYIANAMVAHEINIRRNMFAAAIEDLFTQEVTGDTTFAAFTAVYGQVAFQVADFVEKHSLCEAIAVEVVFPWWAINLFLADIARQNGRALAEIDPTIIRNAFGKLGVAVSFARGLPPAVPANIGGAAIGAGWPDAVPFLMYPAGAFQLGRGLVVDLGVVQDSAKFSTNDYTALFTEECVALVARGPEARYVTVPVCADGTTGSQIANDAEAACPIDGGTVIS